MLLKMHCFSPLSGALFMILVLSLPRYKAFYVTQIRHLQPIVRHLGYIRFHFSLFTYSQIVIRSIYGPHPILHHDLHL